MSVPTDVDPAPAIVAGAGSRRSRLVVLLAAAIVLSALVQALVLQTVVVTSDDLAPTIEPGDHVLVWKAPRDLGPGDLVVVDTTGTAVVDRATPVDDGPLGSVLSFVAGLVGVDIGMQHRLAVVGSSEGAQVALAAPQAASVPRVDVLGTAFLRVWPLSRFGTIDPDSR